MFFLEYIFGDHFFWRTVPIGSAIAFIVTVLIVEAQRNRLKQMGKIPPQKGYSEIFAVKLIQDQFLLLFLLVLREIHTSKDGKAFLRWHFFFACTMILHSALLVMSPEFIQNPTSHSENNHSSFFPDSTVLMNLLRMDKMALLNSIHGVFVIAAAFRFNETKKSNYWWILVVPHSLLTMMSSSALAISAFQLLRFGTPIIIQSIFAFWQFLMAVNCLHWTLRVRCEIQDIPPPSLPQDSNSSFPGTTNDQEARLLQSQEAVPQHPLESEETLGETQGLPDVTEIAERNRVTNQPAAVLITSQLSSSPAARRLQRLTLLVISSELALFAVYSLTILCMRLYTMLPQAENSTQQEYSGVIQDTTSPPSFDTFLHGLVAAYTAILHRGVIVGWGLHGARNGSAEPLTCYWLAASLSGALALAEAVPLARAALSDKMFLISLAMVLAQGAIQLAGAFLAGRLGRELEDRKVEGDKSGSGSGIDLSASTHLRSSRTAGWTLAFAVWWQLECALFVVLPSFSSSAANLIPDVTAVSLNFGLHGCAVLLLSHYRSQERAPYAKMANRMRFYLTFYFMFALISVAEVASAATAGALTMLDVDWPTLMFLFVTLGRLTLALGAMRGFFSLLQLNRQKEMAELERQGSLARTEADPMDDAQDVQLRDVELRVRWASPPHARPEANGFSESSRDDNDDFLKYNHNQSSGTNKVGKHSNALKLKQEIVDIVDDKAKKNPAYANATNSITPPQSEQHQDYGLDLATPELGAKALVIILFVFCGLLVSLEGQDYTGINGALPFHRLFSASDPEYRYQLPAATEISGFHTPAYGILFHFCFILTGYSVLGIRLRNQGHLNFTLLAYRSIAFLSVIATLVCVYSAVVYGMSVLLGVTFVFLFPLAGVAVLDMFMVGHLFDQIKTRNIPQVNKIW